MAKNDKQSKPSSDNNSQNKNNEGDKKSEKKTKKQVTNKPLLAALVLVGLIALAAIGVGVYSLLNTNSDPNSTGDNQTTQTSENTESESSNEESQATENGSESETNENSDATADNNSNENSTDSNTQTNNESNNQAETNNAENAEGTISTAGTNDIVTSGHSALGYQKSLANQASIKASGIWTATDYALGDIAGPNYTVQLGDTLWEISEGYYGTGFRWTEILNKNEDKVGTLPNGERALIFPNVVLNLQ